VKQSKSGKSARDLRVEGPERFSVGLADRVLTRPPRGEREVFANDGGEKREQLLAVEGAQEKGDPHVHCHK